MCFFPPLFYNITLGSVNVIFLKVLLYCQKTISSLGACSSIFLKRQNNKRGKGFSKSFMSLLRQQR